MKQDKRTDRSRQVRQVRQVTWTNMEGDRKDFDWTLSTGEDKTKYTEG